MLKKSFFGLSKPSFYYEPFSEPESDRVDVSSPKTITLHVKEVATNMRSDDKKVINIGDKIKTGQKIYFSNSEVYAISSVTGTVKSISSLISTHGEPLTAISISTSEVEEIDKTFSENCNKSFDLEVMRNFLEVCPGKPPIWRLMNKDGKPPVETIVIYGGDSDLLACNDLNKMVSDDFDAISEGVRLLKKVTGIKKVIFIVPGETIQNYSDHFDVDVRNVSSEYPFAQPMMISYLLTGKLPGYKGIDFTNMCFFRAEAVVNIGRALIKKALPLKKNVTIIDKNGKKHLISVHIGTHISHIFKELGIKIEDEDRLIFGGPMTGDAVYTDNYPILPNTDLIIVQDKTDISKYSNYPCINCGECIKVCPTKVPVNLLVRFLEVGQYEEGADLYDLYSCVECGLCSYVCVSKIPIFQYIKLAKYELNRTGYAEEMNE